MPTHQRRGGGRDSPIQNRGGSLGLGLGLDLQLVQHEHVAGRQGCGRDRDLQLEG